MDPPAQKMLMSVLSTQHSVITKRNPSASTQLAHTHVYAAQVSTRWKETA